MNYIYVTITDININKEVLEKSTYNLYSKYTYNAYFLDITPSEEDIFKNFKSGYRTCVRKFYKENGSVHEDYSINLINQHNEQVKDVFSKHGQSSYNIIRKFKIMYEHVKPGAMLLSIRAEIPENKNIASSCYVGHGDICFWGSNASYRQYLRTCPNQALMWHSILYWKNKGIKIMDMGSLGEYKINYGAQFKKIPRLIYSKYRILQTMIGWMFKIYYKNFKIIGKILSKH